MLSYVHGASATPLLGKTIGEALDAAAAEWADRPAVVSCEQRLRLTWRELKERSDAFAAGLIACGCSPGERIGIWSLNCLEWPITQFAAAKAGLILVTINPAYRLTELEFALNKVGCRTLVLAPGFKTSDYAQMLLSIAPELACCEPGELRAARLPSLRSVIQIGVAPVPGTLAFLEVEAAGRAAGLSALESVERRTQFDDPVNIQFTSGTTGSPKGVTLSHFNILNNGYFVGRRLGLGPADRLCIPVPLYHCFGMVMGNLACLTHGSTMVYPGRGFDAARNSRGHIDGALHGALWRSDHVHRATRTSAICTLRLEFVAHRHHGGVRLPDRGHAAGQRPHAPAGAHDLLWHDGDQPRELSERAQRLLGASRVHRRPDPGSRGIQNHRCRRADRPAG